MCILAFAFQNWTAVSVSSSTGMLFFPMDAVVVVRGENKPAEGTDGLGGVGHWGGSVHPCLIANTKSLSSSTVSGTKKTSPHFPHSYPTKNSWLGPS
jgi:hypothetical protein